MAFEVFEEISQRAKDNDMSIAQYVADVMALHIGREDLVLELGKPRKPTVRQLRALAKQQREAAAAQGKPAKPRRKKQTGQQKELPLAG
ncbi:hypothetical protein [Nocardia yamanashiensis]|uniref:hypothetical protein n=1 Tax=Nocardia yamanashiensis TaxID=209247 RepID=UPI000830E539|nr:hypothetical protein [Nocardia yamanashiensis]